MKAAKDYPGLVTALALALVAAHWGLWRWKDVPALPSEFSDAPEAWSLYVACAGVVAILAGFAGVVIMFGLTPGNDVLVRVREAGGERLRANWVTLVSTPILAALVFVTASAVALAGRGSWGGWIFEVGAVLTLLTAVRLVWIFRLLVRMDLDKKPPAEKSSLELVQEAQVGRGAHRRAVAGRQ